MGDGGGSFAGEVGRAILEEGPPIYRQDRAQRLCRGTGRKETQAFGYDRGVAAADDELRF
jgi:hypothetical protein